MVVIVHRVDRWPLYILASVNGRSILPGSARGLGAIIALFVSISIDRYPITLAATNIASHLSHNLMPLRNGCGDPIVEFSLKPLVMTCARVTDQFGITEPLFRISERHRTVGTEISVLVILCESCLAKRGYARVNGIEELLSPIAGLPFFPFIFGLHE